MQYLYILPFPISNCIIPFLEISAGISNNLIKNPPWWGFFPFSHLLQKRGECLKSSTFIKSSFCYSRKKAYNMNGWTLKISLGPQNDSRIIKFTVLNPLYFCVIHWLLCMWPFTGACNSPSTITQVPKPVIGLSCMPFVWKNIFRHTAEGLVPR